MSAYERDNGIPPVIREALSVQGAAMSGDIAVNILTADVTPAPTAEAWSYEVSFELVDTAGRRHSWFNGDIAAAAADTSTAGTASVSDATPAVVNGVGTVTLSGDAEAWLDTETATLTLDGTVLGVTLTDAEFVVTFTA
jgi:hypothetical protein